MLLFGSRIGLSTFFNAFLFLPRKKFQSVIRAGYPVSQRKDNTNQSSSIAPLYLSGEEDVGQIGYFDTTLRTCALSALRQLTEEITLVREVKKDRRAWGIGRGRGQDLVVELHWGIARRWRRRRTET